MSDYERHLGPRAVSRGLWPVIGLAAAGVLIALLPISPLTKAAAVFAAGMVALLGARSIERMRARQLADLERHARQLVAPDGEPGGEAQPVPAPRAAPGGDPVESLRATLEELAAKRSRQLRELAKKSRNLEALINALDEPVLATDDQERVLLCNRAAEELFDAAPGQLLGSPIAALFTHDVVRAMHSAARRGESRRGRVRLTTAAGTRVFQVSAAPVPVAWGEGVFGAVLLLRDVTELDRAVQVKSDFVANASHELRTPVSAIAGAVETLLEGAAEDPEMSRRLLGMVRTHAARLQEMIRDLLDLSRLESPELDVRIEPVDPGEVVATLRSMFEEVCRTRRLELAVQFAPELAGLRTDRRLLLVVLRNLVENATKFAYEGTRVVVSGKRIEGDGGEARVRFEVIDRGVGIPIELRERVFERYFQVDAARTGGAARRGTGLGLAIVKHAVKALGGEVGVESVWKEGTKVWVELPEAPAPEP